MIITENWLSEWLESRTPIGALLQQLTMAGFESVCLDAQGPGAFPLDTRIGVELTSNRGDCLSIRGFAREVAAITRQKCRELQLLQVQPASTESLPIEILAPKSCPRYLGRIIRGVNVKTETPVFMRERLERCGLHSVSVIVDVLHYVMLELGQPMHAFDLKTLDGCIRVRQAVEGETLLLLDEKTVKLRPETLVIADQKKVLAIAGVMGGFDSRVCESTLDIFIESAFFAPEALFGTARAYGLSTDAAYRFERGVDPKLPKVALERATELLISIAGGKAGIISEVSELQYLPVRSEITLSRKRISQLLGLDAPLPVPRVEEILSALHFKWRSDLEGWMVQSPSFRFDITCEEDLIEELARIEGLEKIPAKPLAFTAKGTTLKEPEYSSKDIRERLVSMGYQEVITYSFIEPSWQKLLYPHVEDITLSNPISSQMAVMRPGLWPGLIKTAQYNQHRQQTRARFFEVGLRFYMDSVQQKVIQEPMVAGLAWGTLFPEQWGEPATPVDFFDLKNDVTALLSFTRATDEFIFRMAREHPALHRGQSACIQFRGRDIGFVGLLHPELLKKLEVTGPLVLFELELAVLLQSKWPQFCVLPKCPFIRRDLALILDKQQDTGSVVQFCKQDTGPLLRQVTVFDVYEGNNLPVGKKSLGLSFILQDPDRTLLDTDVNGIMDNVVAKLTEHFGASLRSS